MGSVTLQSCYVASQENPFVDNSAVETIPWQNKAVTGSCSSLGV